MLSPCLESGADTKQGAGLDLNLETVFPGPIMPHSLTQTAYFVRAEGPRTDSRAAINSQRSAFSIWPPTPADG